MPKPANVPLTLTIEHQPIPVTRIGHGQFSIGYRSLSQPDIVYLVTDRRDCSKEMLWRFAQTLPGLRTRSPHLPRIEARGLIEDGQRQMWETDWSDRLLRAGHPEAYRIRQRLCEHNRAAHIAVARKYGLGYRQSDHLTHTLSYVAEAARQDPAVPATVADALDDLVFVGDQMGGDTFFDFQNLNNLGVRDGVLVLRDCLASARLLDTVHAERAARSHTRRS